MLRVYTASRYFRAKMWLELQKETRHFFHARWLRNYQLNTEETPNNSYYFWQENLQDIQTADIVLCYAEEEDTLGGALVEVGAGIALKKDIILVGKNPAYRSWIYHPSVICKEENIKAALNGLDVYSPYSY